MKARLRVSFFPVERCKLSSARKGNDLGRVMQKLSAWLDNVISDEVGLKILLRPAFVQERIILMFFCLCASMCGFDTFRMPILD